jgi:hypothetical protein
MTGQTRENGKGWEQQPGQRSSEASDKGNPHPGQLGSSHEMEKAHSSQNTWPSGT